MYNHVAAKIQNTARATAVMIREDAPLYLFIAVYTIAGLAFLGWAGAQSQAAYAIYVQRWLMLFAFFFPAIALFADVTYIVHRFDRRRQLALLHVFSTKRLARFFSGLALMQAMLLFQGTFTSVKNALSVWQAGFPYDRIQADIDKALHFDLDPWRWLHAIAGYDWIRTVLEWNYVLLAFALCFGSLFYVATSPRAESVRSRYILAFMLVWIVVGNVLAAPFMSAGPVFYDLVTGDNVRFAPLLDFLARGATSPNSAMAYRDYLWELHSSGQAGFASGISAFPSVHVGLVMLIALFAAEYSKRLGVIAFSYVALIMASSVYLGWHYAIDGYVAAAATLVIHLLLKRAFARREAMVKTEAAQSPLAAGFPVRAS